MAAYAAHTTNYSTHLLTTKKKEKTRATQKNLPFGKRRFREKELRRMGQKQKRVRQKEQKNKRGYIEKWDQTDQTLGFQTRGRHRNGWLHFGR